MRLLPVLAPPFVMLMSACATKHVSRDECRQMLTKYIGMTLGPAERSEPQRTIAERLQEPVYAAREAQCEREVTPKEFSCAMRSGNADEWEACIQ